MLHLEVNVEEYRLAVTFLTL